MRDLTLYTLTLTVASLVGMTRSRAASLNACACGPARWLSVTTTRTEGSCGSLQTVRGALMPLACGALYVGGGGARIALPIPVPDRMAAVTAITACRGTTLDLGATTPAEHGGRSCTSLGCAFGPPVPLINATSPATSACLVGRWAADAVGTVDCATGAATLDMTLAEEIFLTGDLLPAEPGVQPCPLCVHAKCRGGPRNGGPCLAATSTLGATYSTSNDCPPDPKSLQARVVSHGRLTTDTVIAGAIPSSGQLRVFCGYCADSEGALSSVQPSVACLQSGRAGSRCIAPYTTCRQRTSGAFGISSGVTIAMDGHPAGILADGQPHRARMVSVFCIPASANAAANALADLPGPGTISVEGEFQLLR